MNKLVFSQFKKFFSTALLATAALAALPAAAVGTVRPGTLVIVSVAIEYTATRPDGFYVIVSDPVNPGGPVLQGTTTPASCANKWIFIPKDLVPTNDAKVYRDMVSSIQLAIALKKRITIVTGNCYQNVDLTAAAPTSPYNFPMAYGVDIDWR
jgi:hypothetical protein